MVRGERAGRQQRACVCVLAVEGKGRGGRDRAASVEACEHCAQQACQPGLHLYGRCRENEAGKVLLGTQGSRAWRSQLGWLGRASVHRSARVWRFECAMHGRFVKRCACSSCCPFPVAS